MTTKRQQPRQPTSEERLRQQVQDERARVLRLEHYIEEVLGSVVPNDLPVGGWEGYGYVEYWQALATRELATDAALEVA